MYCTGFLALEYVDSLKRDIVGRISSGGGGGSCGYSVCNWVVVVLLSLNVAIMLYRESPTLTPFLLLPEGPNSTHTHAHAKHTYNGGRRGNISARRLFLLLSRQCTGLFGGLKVQAGILDENRLAEAWVGWWLLRDRGRGGRARDTSPTPSLPPLALALSLSLSPSPIINMFGQNKLTLSLPLHSSPAHPLLASAPVLIITTRARARVGGRAGVPSLAFSQSTPGSHKTRALGWPWRGPMGGRPARRVRVNSRHHRRHHHHRRGGGWSGGNNYFALVLRLFTTTNGGRAGARTHARWLVSECTFVVQNTFRTACTKNQIT